MNPQITKLIEENSTSFFVFDIEKLKERVKTLRRSLPEKTELCYAVKANCFLIPELMEEVDSFEICSPGEAHICKNMQVPGERQVISGVYKTPEVMEELIEDLSFKGVFTVESETQFQLLKSLAGKYQRKLKVLLRVTNDSQFGMDEEVVASLVEKREETPELYLLGLQFFSGTQKTSAKKLNREIEHMDQLIQRLFDDYGYIPEVFEYGPGLPVSYFTSEELEEAELLSAFSESLKQMKFSGRIVLELGRSIAASCGSYYTPVVDKKKNKSTEYLLVDGGMHQLVYYGQYMAMKQPHFSVYGKEEEEKTGIYSICGSLCSMNDILVKQVSLPNTEIGDTLVFQNTGAYTVTEGISLFLSRELPAVYFLKEDGSTALVREKLETADFNTPKVERI